MTDSQGSNNNDWCTIESDPGVFTEMLDMLQCPCIELNELYSLDDDTLLSLQNSTRQIYGFIFLFQYNHNQTGSSLKEQVEEENHGVHTIPSDLFFAQQVTTNACATQAILSILFNSMNPTSSSSPPQLSSWNEQQLQQQDADAAAQTQQQQQTKYPTLLTPDEIGPVLYPFYTFVSSFPYHLKGVAISSSEEIKRVHNTFGRADSMYIDTVSPRPTFDPLRHEKSEDVFHFISYVPWYPNGTVYELDGLKPHPIPLGTFDDNNNTSSDNSNTSQSLHPWLVVARDEVQKRISAIGIENVKFNLMAMIHDKRQFYMSQSNNDKVITDYHDYDMNALLEEEHMKRSIWKKENERRRHNYIPFVVQYLREMAKTQSNTSSMPNTNEISSSLLLQMIQAARKRQQEKRQQRKK
jgi:ubiquitin carboxyl-terminal hydrolase L5